MTNNLTPYRQAVADRYMRQKLYASDYLSDPCASVRLSALLLRESCDAEIKRLCGEESE